MDSLLQTAVIVGMFALRLGIPLAITLLVGYWLRRLEDKWQAEARARQETEVTQIQSRTKPRRHEELHEHHERDQSEY